MKIRRRSLRGYAIADVQLTVDRLNQQHAERLIGLEEELALLKLDNKRLRAEIEQAVLQDNTKSKTAMPPHEEAASEELVLTHKDRTKAIVDAMYRLQALQEQQEREIAEKNGKRTALLSQIEQRIKAAFDEFRGGEESK
ncbi:hypothetical protein [Paenibacillus sp. MMO-177]|uniref:hypothetical protein n=1 Tax=Paenibacillus sp. MMO-177 TaxID=3081289 RepID=UPI00301640C0